MGQSPTSSVFFSQKHCGPKSFLQQIWCYLKKTLPVNVLPHSSAHPFSLCFSFNPTYVGRGASETCFSVTVTRRPGSPLDIPIVEDDEGRLGVGGQDGLEGVALQKGRRR